LLLKLLFC